MMRVRRSVVKFMLQHTEDVTLSYTHVEDVDVFTANVSPLILQ